MFPKIDPPAMGFWKWLFLRYVWKNHISIDVPRGGGLSWVRTARFRGDIYLLGAGFIPRDDKQALKKWLSSNSSVGFRPDGRVIVIRGAVSFEEVPCENTES